MSKSNATSSCPKVDPIISDHQVESLVKVCVTCGKEWCHFVVYYFCCYEQNFTTV